MYLHFTKIMKMSTFLPSIGYCVVNVVRVTRRRKLPFNSTGKENNFESPECGRGGEVAKQEGGESEEQRRSCWKDGRDGRRGGHHKFCPNFRTRFRFEASAPRSYLQLTPTLSLVFFCGHESFQPWDISMINKK